MENFISSLIAVAMFNFLMYLDNKEWVDSKDLIKYKAAYEDQQESNKCDTFEHPSNVPSLCKFKESNKTHNN